MFWRAVENERFSLLPTTLANQGDPRHGAEYTYVTQYVKPPVRLELKLRMRPMGRDVLQDLVDSGHLDPEVMDKMPTFTVAEWQGQLSATAREYELQQTGDGTCAEYEELMYPDD